MMQVPNPNRVRNMVAAAVLGHAGQQVATKLASAIRDRVSKPKQGKSRGYSGAGSRLASAPAAFGGIEQGPRFTFGSCVRSGMRGLKFGMNFLWSLVQTSASGTAILTSTNGNPQSYLPFDPDNTLWMPQVVTNFVRPFTRWSLEEIEFEYLPGCPTSTVGEIAFGWDTDAGDARPADPTNILFLANSMGGAPWVPMKMKVPVDKQLRYTYNSAVFGSLSVPEVRQDVAGWLVGQSSGVAASTALGFMRVRATICLFELNPTNVQTSLLDLRRVDLCSSCRKIARESDPRLDFTVADRRRNEEEKKRRLDELLDLAPIPLRRQAAYCASEEKKESSATALATAVPALVTVPGGRLSPILEVQEPDSFVLVKSAPADRLTMLSSVPAAKDARVSGKRV